jgi:flagellar basal-body rod protein FlgF
MLLRLQNGLSAMRALMRQQERVSENLANVNTVGYKRDRTFTEALRAYEDVESTPRSDRAVTQWAELAPGSLDATGNPLDVALEGEGFFVFTDAQTGLPRYSRAGRLTLDDEGTLRDPAGHALEGEEGPIQVPPAGGAIEISQQGEVRAGGQVVGQLQVVTFEDPSALRRLDGAAFDAGGQEPLPVENPVVRQGYLEGSNVDAVREMTDMIAYYRQFESHQRMLRTTDEILGAATRDLGKF